MSGYYTIKPSAGQYHFTLHAANHEVILSSERYTTKQSAEGGIQSCQQNSPHDEQYERLIAKNDAPYFTLNATNGKVIGTSQMYSSTTARDAGINSVKANGSTTVIQDLT